MRCLVFCDALHDIYLNILVRYARPELELIKAYYFGDEFASAAGIQLFPLSTIVDKESFDTAIILFSETDVLRQLISKVYGVDFQCTVVDLNSFAKECLTGAGQLELLRLDIEYKCPSNYNFVCGDFSYYVSLDIKDDIKDGSVKVRVGKFCSIGPGVSFLLGVEHRSDWGTSYPFNRLLGREANAQSSVASKGDIVIGNDVWIGANATVLSGVNIGDGCVVGSNTVVSKSVEPYSIIVGNPGRVVKERFLPNHIDMLMEMKWWDWDYQKIFDALDIIQSNDVEALYLYWKRSKNEDSVS
ncbi:CatB-related O-acetyltransferase [Butyrivibrio sp. VCB2001]|uniref:CatB-related O-acetyltransferase n=1 Tax=Butyrivibrio sp. VCB2001 TaxID=1280667 RepID=UPI000411057B|nr:CatB-related O-acetyltransferase [Butyrivibrio sp. VCB2001]